MKNLKKIDHKRFINKLKNDFPEIKEELENEVLTGLLHLEIAVFARYVQKMVAVKNFEESKRCFFWINKISINCTDDIVNAIGVSFFENLDLDNDNYWAFNKLLTSEQKQIYNVTHGRN